MANEYASLAELKAWLGITDTADDASLTARLNAASRWIDHWCGRRFYLDGSDVKRYFTSIDDTFLAIDDLNSITTLKTDEDGNRSYETTWAATDYDLEPSAKLIGGVAHPIRFVHVTPQGTKRFPLYRKSIEVDGKWGWPAVPEPVTDACLVLAARLFKRKEATFGSIGSPDLGEQRIVSNDPDVKLLLDPFVIGQPVIA